MSDSMKNQPTEPLTALGEGAAAIHELFMSYIEAGFTERQALTLVGHILSAAVNREGGAGKS